MLEEEGRPDAAQFAGGQDGDPVAQVLGLVHVVGAHEDCAVGALLHQDVPDLSTS